jgi:uncharacterized membrane protein
MSLIERRLCQSGLALFFLGLPLGFLIQAMPNHRVGLSAHLNAVQSGTALTVIGILWPRLRITPRFATPLATALALSFWGLELRILASALDLSSSGPMMRTATVVGALSALVMLIAVGTALLALRSPASERAIVSSTTAVPGD